MRPVCRSAVFQRSRRRCRLPPVHRLPPWGTQTSRLELGPSLPSTGKMFVWRPAIPLRTRFCIYDISPHRHSQLSDLIIRLYSTTFLKSISLKWWLSPNVQTDFINQFNSVDICHVIKHCSLWLVNRLTAVEYC